MPFRIRLARRMVFHKCPFGIKSITTNEKKKITPQIPMQPKSSSTHGASLRVRYKCLVIYSPKTQPSFTLRKTPSLDQGFSSLIDVFRIFPLTRYHIPTVHIVRALGRIATVRNMYEYLTREPFQYVSKYNAYRGLCCGRVIEAVIW